MIWKSVDDSSLSLREHLGFVELLADAMDQAVLITAAHQQESEPPILYVNEAFTELTGFQAEDVIGRSPNTLHARFFSGDTLDFTRTSFGHRGLLRGTAPTPREKRTRPAAKWEIVPFHDPSGKRLFYFVVQRKAR